MEWDLGRRSVPECCLVPSVFSLTVCSLVLSWYFNYVGFLRTPARCIRKAIQFYIHGQLRRGNLR